MFGFGLPVAIQGRAILLPTTASEKKTMEFCSEQMERKFLVLENFYEIEICFLEDF